MDIQKKLKSLKRDDILSALLLVMGLIWFSTYLLESSYNVFWAGSAGMRLLPFLTAAMLVDTLL